VLTTKSSARHLTALKKILAQNPMMPGAYYEPNATAIMQFYLLMGEGTNLYMKGNVQECYKLFRQAWDIQERTANLRIRKSDAHFLNKIAIEIATARYREAIKTAEELIEFQKEQRHEEKRLKGYAEMALVYSYSWPALRCPNPEFIMRMLREYITVLKRTKSPDLDNALSTQAIFHFLCGDFKTANKLIAKPNVRAVFDHPFLDGYIDLLSMNSATPREKVNALRKKTLQQIHNVKSSDVHFSMKRVMNFIDLLEELLDKAGK
jgi:hypothetical protein